MHLEGEMGELGMRKWSSVIVSLLWIIILLDTQPLLLFKIRLITLHVFCILLLYPLNRSWYYNFSPCFNNFVIFSELNDKFYTSESIQWLDTSWIIQIAYFMSYWIFQYFSKPRFAMVIFHLYSNLGKCLVIDGTKNMHKRWVSI